jgi:peptide chain release factor 3
MTEFVTDAAEATLPRTAPDDRLAIEVARRRTFAIISHPDAGKTTLTEKLLLYGGAIHLAGSVKARRATRHATSDWMKLEQERGISVTSSVLQFEYLGYQLNLLDTPGHEDFSEDTYRTLVAADSAIMLLDNRKGVEERTRQLFDVCKLRRTPIFTLVNKCDRHGEDPLKLIQDVESDLGIDCYAATWPVFENDVFVGVYDRLKREVHLFERSGDRGATRADDTVVSIDDVTLRDVMGARACERLTHDIELLDAAGHEYEHARVIDGTLTPVFFGSALTNFGIEPFLREFLELAPPPGPRESSVGPVTPDRRDFTGFVFKIQANMDPKHRDRVAFVRIVSGHFEANMQVLHQRSAKPIRLAAPQQFMARDRVAIEEAWPGDVIGIMDRGSLRIGDTLGGDAGRPTASQAVRQRLAAAYGGGRGAGVFRRVEYWLTTDRGRGGATAVRRDGVSLGTRICSAVPVRENELSVAALAYRKSVRCGSCGDRSRSPQALRSQGECGRALSRPVGAAPRVAARNERHVSRDGTISRACASRDMRNCVTHPCHAVPHELAAENDERSTGRDRWSVRGEGLLVRPASRSRSACRRGR